MKTIYKQQLFRTNTEPLFRTASEVSSLNRYGAVDTYKNLTLNLLTQVRRMAMESTLQKMPSFP